MEANIAIFCPYCSGQAGEPPVSPMTRTVVKAVAGEAANRRLQPTFMYRCERCGYAELHDRLLDAA